MSLLSQADILVRMNVATCENGNWLIESRCGSWKASEGDFFDFF